MTMPDGTRVAGTGPFKGREYVWLGGKLCRIGKSAFKKPVTLNHPNVPRSIGRVDAHAKAFQDG